MSCNSCSNITLPQGATGAQGASGTNGTDGSNGIFGGYSLEWEFDDNTSASPATTKIRLNNAAYASVTKIYIHENNIDSVDSTAFLASFDDTGDVNNHGYIRLFKQHDSTNFWLGKVKSVTDNGSDFTVDVEYILHNGAFAALDDVVVSFVANGANGAINSGVLDNYSILDDGLDYNSLTPVKVREFQIPANTFVQDKDEVSIDYGFSGDYFPLNLDFDMNTTVNGMYFLQVRVVQGATTRYVELLNDGALPVTTVSTSWFPGGTCRLKLYKQAAGGLRPVLLSKIGSEIGSSNLMYPGDVQTTDSSAFNQEDFLLSEAFSTLNGFFNTNNASIAPIDGFNFAQAIDIEVYMWRTEFSDGTAGGASELPPGTRPDFANVKFRLMNLHASFNKVL